MPMDSTTTKTGGSNDWVYVTKDEEELQERDYTSNSIMSEDNFFAAPPSEDPPMPDDGGFTLLGDAPADTAYVGDVQDMGFTEAPEDMGFAGGDMGYTGGEMGFAGGDVGGDGGYEAPADDFASPSIGDAPIVLGPPSDDILEASPEAAVAETAIVTGPSPMQKWNEEWQATLQARKEEENAMKAEMVEAARIALEEFQRDREAKREAKMAKNREDEQAKLEAIEADLENDNSWQRVCKMVDLTGTEGGEDTKRMRDVFIVLKNEQALAAKIGA